VFALEASRLARNNRDWHHLVDLCALAETLLVDSDGIYDPRLLNDRLLLGLKGSIAEFELGLFRQRAREAFEQKVKRGFALWEAPVGFLRTEEGRIEKTPDRSGPTVDRECVPEVSAIKECPASDDLVSGRADSGAAGKAGHGRERSNVGLAEQWKNPSDVEESLL
jgi:DNA invertase Pin-like site-specific DNA recombinase